MTDNAVGCDGNRKIKLSAPPRRTQHDIMKQNLIRLSQQYVTALEKSLKRGPQADLQPALDLGRAAVALGLETLDLARMHEQALVTLELSNVKNAFTKLAGKFFNEANRAVEESHSAVPPSNGRLSRLKEKLGLRTEELAVSKRELQRGAAQRKTFADAAEKSGQHYRQSLKESLQLQKRLRKLTHRVMLTQENDRRNISHELQDEIAQTLLGINVRLLSLKEAAHSNTKSFRAEIASTQRLVLKSAQSVRRVAREIGHEPGDLS